MAKRISSPEQAKERFWSRVDKSGECWLWTGARGGYRQNYGVFSPHGQRMEYCHRFAYRTTFGEIPAGLFVCHRCHNGLCVNPNHLYLGTPAQNTKDAMRDGLIRKGVNSWSFQHYKKEPPLAAPVVILANCGTRNVRAKLTDDDVREIRRLVDNGIATRTDVAKQFGIARSNVRQIVDRITWRHVGPDPDDRLAS